MDKEHEAIQKMQLAGKMSLAYYKQPLIICNSGGKDSLVLIEIAKRSGIPFEVMHSHTTADAPETVYYVRQQMKELEDAGIKTETKMPTYQGKPINMWSLIPLKLMPPTRLVRYCCAILKETGGEGRAIATGVRNSESTQRASRNYAEVIGKTKKDTYNLNFNDAAELFETDTKRTFVEHDDKFINSCKLKGKTVFNPIIDWSDRDVWEFIRGENLNYNTLYDEPDICRVGCVGCPIAGKRRYKEFARWPKFKDMYINAFERMINVRKEKGMQTKWKTGNDVFDWWMQDDNVPGQMSFDDMKWGDTN